MTDKINNYTNPNFEDSIKTLNPEIQSYMRRYYHMSDDEIIDIFLPMNFYYKNNADEEHRFRENIQLLKSENLYYLMESEGLYTITKNGNVTSFDQTYKAKEVQRAGGWLKYLKDISDAKERKKNLEITTININKTQKFIVIITLLIIVGNLIVDILNFQTAKDTKYQDALISDKLKELNSLRTRMNSIEIEQKNISDQVQKIKRKK